MLSSVRVVPAADRSADAATARVCRRSAVVFTGRPRVGGSHRTSRCHRRQSGIGGLRSVAGTVESTEPPTGMEGNMDEVVPTAPRASMDYSELPARIPLEDVITTQATREAPDPTMGRDTESEFLLRNAAG